MLKILKKKRKKESKIASNTLGIQILKGNQIGSLFLCTFLNQLAILKLGFQDNKTVDVSVHACFRRIFLNSNKRTLNV
jgi:hypothetical protein